MSSRAETGTRLPVRSEFVDLAQRGVEVTPEADGAVVDEHVRRGFAIGDFGDEIIKRVLLDPGPDVLVVARREDHDAVSASPERFEKLTRARPGRVEMSFPFPPGLRVDEAVQ